MLHLGDDKRSWIPTSRVRAFPRIGTFDVVWAFLTPILAFLVRDGTVRQVDVFAIYCCTALIASLVVFQWFKINSPLAPYFSINDALTITKATLTTVALTTVVIFTFTRLEDAPRSVPLIHFLLLTSGLIAERSAVRLASRGAAKVPPAVHYDRIENVLLIGATRLAWFYSRLIDEFAASERRVVAILDGRQWIHNRTLNGYPIVGGPGDLNKVVAEYATHGVAIGRVAIAQDPNDISDTVWNEIQSTCKANDIQLEWLPERFMLLSSAPSASIVPTAADLPMIEPAGERPYWRIKRALDLVGSVCAMVVIAPLALLVAVLVLIDVGLPIVFWQQRVGYRGQPLYLYKFRTMQSAFGRDGQAISETERTSSLGWILRKSRLDEIPQLFNIFMGHMSFVGPRPLLPVDQPKNNATRLQIRPGLTGLAQINGGKLLSPEEKEAVDNWYARNASLWLDFKIIVRTLWVVLRGDRRNEPEIASMIPKVEFGERTASPAKQA